MPSGHSRQTTAQRHLSSARPLALLPFNEAVLRKRSCRDIRSLSLRLRGTSAPG